MHNFVTEICTHVNISVIYNIVRCGIWDWCIVRFVQQVYYHKCNIMEEGFLPGIHLSVPGITLTVIPWTFKCVPQRKQISNCACDIPSGHTHIVPKRLRDNVFRTSKTLTQKTSISPKIGRFGEQPLRRPQDNVFIAQKTSTRPKM